MAQHITVSSPGVIAVTPNYLSKYTTKFVPVSNIAGFTIKAFYDRSTLTIHSSVAREDIAVFDNLPNAEIAAIKDVLVHELRDREKGFDQKVDERLVQLEEWTKKMEWGTIRDLVRDVTEISGKSHEARMLSTCIDLSLPSWLRKKIHKKYSVLNEYNDDYYLDTFGPVIDDSIYSEDRDTGAGKDATQALEEQALEEQELKEEEPKEEPKEEEPPKQEAAVVPVPVEDHLQNIKYFSFLLLVLYYVLTRCPGFCNMRSLA